MLNFPVRTFRHKAHGRECGTVVRISTKTPVSMDVLRNPEFAGYTRMVGPGECLILTLYRPARIDDLPAADGVWPQVQWVSNTRLRWAQPPVKSKPDAWRGLKIYVPKGIEVPGGTVEGQIGAHDTPRGRIIFLLLPLR